MLKNVIAIVSTTVTLMLSGCGSEAVDKPMNANSENSQVETETQLTSESIIAETSEISTEATTITTATETTTKAPTVINTSNLSNEKLSWYFNPNDEHKKPTASDKVD